MQNTFKEIATYLRNPNCNNINKTLTTKQKWTTVLHALILSFLSVIPLTILFSLFDHFEIIDMDKHANAQLFDEFSPLVILFMVAVLAPLIEELMFRAPITLFCKYKKGFKYIFYGFAVLFGYIHIFNFEIETTVILLSPILVLPQIILGLILGYLRVKLGLIYSIILHALYNGILTLPMLLFGDMLGVQ